MANHRANLAEMLRFGKPEELCLFELGYWGETVERWKTEGMPPGLTPWDAAGITTYERVPVEVRMFPPFQEQVLEEDEDTRLVRDGGGIVKRESKHATAFPYFVSHPVATLRDFEALKERLDPRTPGRFPKDWDAAARRLESRSEILVMGCVEISFFGWHRDLLGLERLLTAYYDEPGLIHAISRHHLAFLKELYGRIARDVKFDFIFMWEDMSYKNGPLISPALVREFMLPYYREIMGFFRELGNYRVILDSDGDVTKLIPLFMEAGVNGMLPFECAAGMDVTRIGREYPELFIAGGIDKRVFAQGREAIDRELESKLPAMFKRGGYLPSLDHHVPPSVSWQDFLYYIERTRELWRRFR
jgi:uroporphyrinogen decarboxylase